MFLPFHLYPFFRLIDFFVCFSSSGMGGSSREPRLVVPFRNFEEEMKHPGVWEAEKRSTSTADAAQDNLASLYRPPFALMYHGSFEKVSGPYQWKICHSRISKYFICFCGDFPCYCCSCEEFSGFIHLRFMTSGFCQLLSSLVEDLYVTQESYNVVAFQNSKLTSNRSYSLYNL